MSGTIISTWHRCEKLSSAEWESVLQEVVEAAQRDQEWNLVVPRVPESAPEEETDGPGLWTV